MSTGLDLAETIAKVAGELGIDTAIIGAMALAAHNYVRGTADVAFATCVDPRSELPRLQAKLESLGLRTKLNMPDADDPIGGLLRVWEGADEDGDPIDPVDIVNFFNPFRPSPNPGGDTIREAIRLDATSSLRYARMAELIALKLYAGSRRDQADVVELLTRNPDAAIAEIRGVCARYSCEHVFDELLAEARASRA